jgi:hypothetical protein
MPPPNKIDEEELEEEFEINEKLSEDELKRMEELYKV